MSVKDIYTAQPIKKELCKEWVMKKHYKRKTPPIQFSYGLFNDKRILQGICTFSIPASRFNLSLDVYELNRLCINEGLEKNILSYFVSSVLKQIKPKKIIVSYADPNQHHHGYIYQATNWIYTGLSTAEKRIFINKKELHRRTLYDNFGTSSIKELKKMGLNVEQIKQKAKHRYFYILDNKKNRQKIFNELKNKYKLYPYPKGTNKRYEASYKPVIQHELF